MKKRKRYRTGSRLTFSAMVSMLLLTILSALILLPIVMTFLYSFFPKGEIQGWLAQRGSYIFVLAQSVVQRRIGHGRNNRIRIRVPVAGHINGIHKKPPL